MDDLSNFSPEQLQQLMELGVLDDEGNIINGQLKTAEALRYGASPKGTDLGYTYTAANPLEHVADVYQKYQTGKEIKELRTKQQDTLDKQTAARNMFLKMLRGGGGQQSGPPQLGALNPMIGA